MHIITASVWISLSQIANLQGNSFFPRQLSFIFIPILAPMLNQILPINLPHILQLPYSTPLLIILPSQMHQEANKGFLQIPQAFIHGSKNHLATDQELLTLPHYHHPESYMHLNYPRLFLNTPKLSNQFWLPHELSSSPTETSSLTLNSADEIPNFNIFTEAKSEDQMEELDMIVNERRVRRLISNRESARRSRMRKRKQLEELQGQVLQLLAANTQLTERLNQVLEINYRVLQENSQLKEENSSFKMAVTDFVNQNHEHVGPEAVERNTIRVRANHTITSSMDIIH